MVAIGPKIALATIGGIQITGFLIILGTCNIDVPNPWASNPFQRLALKLITAKPTIWAAHPTVDAPAAIPDNPKMIDNAAELIGNVKIIPITTETTTPIINGCNSVASLINVPRIFIPFIKYGPVK